MITALFFIREKQEAGRTADAEVVSACEQEKRSDPPTDAAQHTVSTPVFGLVIYVNSISVQSFQSLRSGRILIR